MAKIEVPDGFKVMNPAPLDAWQGPYSGSTEAEAKASALASIPSAVRYVTMEVRLIISGVAKNFWFENGVSDNALVERYLVDNPELGESIDDIQDQLNTSRPATFAQMKTMLVRGVAKHYTVQEDEFNGGIEDNLIFFDGQYLYAFGVKIDDSEQPVFD